MTRLRTTSRQTAHPTTQKPRKRMRWRLPTETYRPEPGVAPGADSALPAGRDYAASLVIPKECFVREDLQQLGALTLAHIEANRDTARIATLERLLDVIVPAIERDWQPPAVCAAIREYRAMRGRR